MATSKSTSTRATGKPAGAKTPSARGVASAAVKNAAEDLPPRPVSREEAVTAAARQARVAAHLCALAKRPPQVLILEGGTPADREAMALFWTARLNCREDEPPCLSCRRCSQALAKTHRDLFFLDGSQGTIKIETVRELRSILGEPPRDDGFRSVILHEAQSLSTEAANALLKSLEEPRPGTCFTLLAAQRERLLPTLVSRGWVLTLAWPVSLRAGVPGEGDCVVGPADTEGEIYRRAVDLAGTLAAFLRTGRGWFQITGARGAVDRELARRLTVLCQRELARAMTGAPALDLGLIFARDMDARGRRTVDVALAECQDALDANVRPELALDWLATRMHALAAHRS